MKQLMSFLIILLLSSPAISQDKTFTVTGRVVDAKSGTPLANASVFCQNTTVGTVSKADGSFFCGWRMAGMI